MEYYKIGKYLNLNNMYDDVINVIFEYIGDIKKKCIYDQFNNIYTSHSDSFIRGHHRYKCIDCNKSVYGSKLHIHMKSKYHNKKRLKNKCISIDPKKFHKNKNTGNDYYFMHKLSHNAMKEIENKIIIQKYY